MFTIRKEQMAVLAAQATERHVRRVMAFVRDHYPEAVADISEDAALARVRWGLSLARKFGIDEGRAAALFTVLLFAAGPTFYQHPACREILGDPRFHPASRVGVLFAGSVDFPWDNIASVRDESAWPI